MASSIEMLKIDLVDQLEYMARAKLDDPLRDTTAAFVRTLYKNVPPSDLVPERPESLVAAALSLFQFCRVRARGETKLRIENPTLETHGFRCRHTVVEMVNDDMPFLVDSVRIALTRLGAEVHLLVHPIFEVQRDAEGHLTALSDAGPTAPPGSESVMHVRVEQKPQAEHPAIEAALRAVLADVRRTIDDFDAMLDRCRQTAEALCRGKSPDPEDARETSEFLDWLADDHFTFQGYSYCRFERAPLSSRPLPGGPPIEDAATGVRFDRDRGLGILRDPNRSMFDVFEPPRKYELLRVLKANRKSTVHREVHLDTIIVSDFDAAGVQQGAHMFVGLFTASAYAERPHSIPLLHHKIERVVLRSGFSEGGHDEKMLRYILETYPRDELLQISDDDLFSISLGIFHLQYRKRVALFVRRDPFGRFVSCLIYLPRDRMDTTLRLRVQDIVASAFNGSLAAYYPHLSDDPLARLHLIVKTPAGTPERMDFVALERRIEDATRSWQDRLARTLPAELGEERGRRLTERYGQAFPASYREDFDDIAAVTDIEHVEEALETGKLTLLLYRAADDPARNLRFKVFSPTGYVALSDVLPILENLGLRVLGEVPYDIHVAGETRTVFLHDLTLEMRADAAIESPELRAAFTQVFSQAWEKRVDDDGFNGLVLRAGLSARHVVLLRAYAKYLRQIRVPFSEGYMQQALEENREITRLLIELFSARFDPERSSAERASALETELSKRLDAVQSLDEDRILRLFRDVILATVRTNFYQQAEGGDPIEHLAFKIDSGRVPAVPKPAPFREIFVSGPRVHGVHLRFGEVARGGLRWSDRLEDFRTEILGLAKAQQVKNAVIVPVGSKGGFVVRRPPPASAGRDALREEGIACYEIFISCLLDLTDNRRRRPGPGDNGSAGPMSEVDEIVVPALTRCHDGSDPYLVVAADKGTATFSDIANAISQRRGFWLDDAFASGGSAGYDHKQMGITARGAWESVKRHFRELGKDIQSESFTCVGVGDMSGDVFGNGMLLSEHTLLVAAFDHRHVFVDPDPDPARSWRERRRLFDLDRSSWDDYDRGLLSEGGGIYPRSVKRIELSERARLRLGMTTTSVTPAELIRGILQAPVELAFFGGIGTYVRASDETDAQAGDHQNDALRIAATKLRAKVVGEGANLALTQRARIEYALAGGRCNSDFIDNSAGVDCSDHEVNIKILLGDVERHGRMTREQRNEVLRLMTDDVAQLVLQNTYLQTQSLSVSTGLSLHLSDRIARSMRALEKAGKLNRRLESLPDDETLLERQRLGVGFVRPELCVLMSYAKNALSEALLECELPQDPLLERDLIEYFPERLRQQFRAEILNHRLRREITATLVTNDVINRIGIAVAHEINEATGASAGDLVMAYVAARELLDARRLWREIEALDNRVAADVQAELLVECSRLVERVTVWLLREHGGGSAHRHVEAYRVGLQRVAAGLDEQTPASEVAVMRKRVEALCSAGVPEKLALDVARLHRLLAVVDVVRVSELSDMPLEQAARLYFAVGRRFGFDWLRDAAARLPARRSWDRQAVAALRDELFAIQRDMTRAVLEENGHGLEGDRIDAWTARRYSSRARCEQLLAELQASANADFAMLTVAARQLSGLLSVGSARSTPPPPSMVQPRRAEPR